MRAGWSCRSTTTARSRGRWPARSPRRSREARDADERAERLGAGRARPRPCTPVDDRRVVEEPAPPGRRRSPSRGLSAVMRPMPVEPCSVWWSRIQPEPVLEALGEALVEHRAVEHVLRRVADRRGAAAAAASRAQELVVDATRGRSPCRATCSAGRPCRSRRTARPRRRGRGRRRPSRPSGSCRRARGTATAGGGRTARRSRAPTAVEPVKPTLSTSRSSSARSRPANVCAPSASTRLSTPSGTPPAQNSSASASPSAAAYSAGFQTTALPHSSAGTRYQRRHGDREVAGGDDRRDADRHAEREQLLVGHLASARSGRTGAGPRRGRSRRCR